MSTQSTPFPPAISHLPAALWFMFYVEAECDSDPEHSVIEAWVVSVQANSEEAADVRARDRVLAQHDVNRGQRVQHITHVSFQCMADREVFRPLGELVQ